MEAAAIRKVGQDPEHADEAPEVSQALLELKRIGIFNEIDKQLLIVSHATAALIDTQAYPVVTKSEPLRATRLRSLVRTDAGCSTSLAAGEDFHSLL